MLHLTRPWLWDRLDPRVQERVVGYLMPAIGSDYPPINWIWFQIVVEQFLLSVGGTSQRADMRRDIDEGRACGIRTVPYGDAIGSVVKRSRFHAIAAAVGAEAADVPGDHGAAVAGGLHPCPVSPVR